MRFQTLLNAIPDRLLYGFFLFVLCFSHIHQGTLGADGVRYAHIAQQILERADWWSLYDEFKDSAYGNKPPFLFWMVAGLFDLVGFSTFASRVLPVCLVFSAMIILFRSVQRHVDTTTAALAVALFSLNAQFFRAALDLNFEGFVLLGGVLCLDALLGFLHGRAQFFQFSAGLLLLFASKPPFVVFPVTVFFGLLATKLAMPKIQINLRFSLGQWIKLLISILAPLALYLIFLGYQSAEIRAIALQNQLARPFDVSQGFFSNLIKWLRTYFFYFAPLSLVGLFALTSLVRRGEVKADDWLCVIWCLPILPIVLLVDIRGPYLFLPLLSLTILSARYLSRTVSRIALRKTLRAGSFFGSIALIAAGVLGVPLHTTDEVLRFLQHFPHYSMPSVIVCVDGNDGKPSLPRVKRLQMLLELELGRRTPVYASHILPLSSDTQNRALIANHSCWHNLQLKGLQGVELDRHEGIAAWRLTNIPESARISQLSYQQFKADFGEYN